MEPLGGTIARGSKPVPCTYFILTSKVKFSTSNNNKRDSLFKSERFFVPS
jgi:hypothetical protein